MNTRSFVISCISILIITSLSSYKKKFKQKIYGKWMEVIFVDRGKKYGEPLIMGFSRELIVFNKNGTGYRRHYVEASFIELGADNYIDKEKSTSYAYEFTVPFTFTLSKDDIGNMITINYEKGGLDSVDVDDIPETREVALSMLKPYQNIVEKYYWKIRPDSNDRNHKALQYLQPGTSVTRSYQTTRRDYRYKAW